MLRFGTVTIAANYEPPRPAITPRRRIVTMRQGTVDGCQPEHREDWGLSTTRIVRFVSSETQGFVTPAQAVALLALYESGAAFALETDLLGPLGGANVTYAAHFDPDSAPTFTPATPGARLYYFDISVQLS